MTRNKFDARIRTPIAALLATLLPVAGAWAQAAPAAAASAPTASASAAQDDGLQSVTVTAQRVKQRLQDVSAAITAFSPQAIEQLQIDSLVDISRVAPNVKFDAMTGGSTSLKPFIRGGGVTDGSMLTSESEVGIYVDDVYRARLSAGLVDFVQLDRIEVMRGPQGVLYGRNSSAGAVNIITRAPGAEFSANIEAGVGNFGERRLKGYVSGALSQDKRWRGSLQGMVRGRDTNGQYNVTLGKDVGGDRSQGFQGDLAFEDGDLKARLSAFVLHNAGDGQWAVPTTVDANGSIVPSTGSYRRVASPTPSLTDVTQAGTTLRLSKDVGEVRLTSITGFVKLKDHWREDFSGGVDGALIGLADAGTLALFDRESRTTHHQFSQELQAAGSFGGGRLDYVGGLYFFGEKGRQDVDSSIFFTPSSVTFDADTTSVAAFGQLGAHLGDKATLVLGGRFTSDDKRIAGTLGGEGFSESSRYRRFTPKLGLDYKVAADVLLYASYSEGFKSGGYNGLASTVAEISQPFLPQLTDAYEAGVKADLLDHKLRVNAALFYNRIRNRQQTLTVASGPEAGSFVVENYDARLTGLELELAWKAMPGLSLWANGALNDGKYTSCSSAVSSCSIIDNKLPVFPRFSYTVGADHEEALGAGRLRTGADFSVRAPYFSTADNVAIGAVERQKFLNAYLAYDLGNWTYQLAGKNLLQEQGWQTGFGFSVVQPRFAIPARTFLLSARYEF
jgi:iron complex outermembrane receptor protein